MPTRFYDDVTGIRDTQELEITNLAEAHSLIIETVIKRKQAAFAGKFPGFSL